MKKNITLEKDIPPHHHQSKIITKSFNIIMVSDDNINRQFFKQAFEELEIVIALNMPHNGQQLMSLLSKNKVALPHLIILHFNTTSQNGITYLKEIKSIREFEDVTIGIYSGNNSEKEKSEIFLHGANIYIHKKNTISELTQALQKVITSTFVYENPPLNKNNFVMTV